MLISWQRSATLTFLAPLLALRGERMYRALPELPAQRPYRSLPSLSFIVPARNEAANLCHLLPSLQAVEYPGALEIILVDDNSTDETAILAESCSIKVVRLTELPDGWYGKPHACHRGAEAATGDWLLFTDADTVHSACGPARAVAYALDHGLDGLSLFLRQECQGLADRLALTAAFAGLFAGSRGTDEYFNGQYILLNRTVYETSGGFSAVRNELLEDLALGRHLRWSGYQVKMMRGETAATAHMYKNMKHTWVGMSRLSSGSLPWSGWRAGVTIFFITATMTPLIVLMGVMTGNMPRRWLIVTWATAVSGIFPWAERFGSIWWAFLSPIGAFFVQLAAVWGLISRLIGRSVHWKERQV